MRSIGWGQALTLKLQHRTPEWKVPAELESLLNLRELRHRTLKERATRERALRHRAWKPMDGQNKRHPSAQTGNNVPSRDHFDFDEKGSSFVAKTGTFVVWVMTEPPDRCHD